jgi:NosR/NirI family transcriptional regulator, nitrous oxide reductase regulator
VAVGGSAERLYRQHLLSIQQGDNPARFVPLRRFVTAGNAGAGMIAGRASYSGAIVLEEDFDVTEPIKVIYHPQGSEFPYEAELRLDGIPLALARNEPVLSVEELERARWADAGFFTRMRHDPPWGETPWTRVILLLGVLSLVMAAFISKSARIRWSALSVTLVYLGFIDGGFLSVSHITGFVAQGPRILSTNLPMMIIVAFTLITTLLWGRIFCSTLCPFGALQDFITKIRMRFAPRHWQQIRMPQAIHDRSIYIKYAILTLIVATAMVNNNISIFQYFEPFGTLFYFSPSLLLWGILAAMLLASLVIDRFYCRYLCPLGAALGLVSLLSPLRIARVSQCGVCKVCEHACPTGAIRGAQIDFKECVRCDICESKLITKAGSCKHSMEEITRRRKDRNAIPVVNLTPTPLAAGD